MKVKILAASLLLFSCIALSQFVFYKLDIKLTKLSKCPEEVLSRLDEVKMQVPDKIVMKPWNGRHNVYGIFMLPIEDNSSKRLVISIAGAGNYCGGTHNVGTSFEGIQAKPGYYLLKANFRTRTSTWLIARGFANQLENSLNWKLVND